jgi:hypothetical protein
LAKSCYKRSGLGEPTNSSPGIFDRFSEVFLDGENAKPVRDQSDPVPVHAILHPERQSPRRYFQNQHRRRSQNQSLERPIRAQAGAEIDGDPGAGEACPDAVEKEWCVQEVVCGLVGQPHLKDDSRPSVT